MIKGEAGPRRRGNEKQVELNEQELNHVLGGAEAARKSPEESVTKSAQESKSKLGGDRS